MLSLTLSLAAPAAEVPKNLKSPENAADYLAICPAPLCEGIKPLAELRRKQGLRVRVAPVENIEKEFPAENRAESIRGFLRHAWAGWQPPAPRYVLFVGDAVSLEGEDPALLIPHLSLESDPRAYVRDEKEFIGTDNFYALMDDDDIPDFAIGRLPVDNRKELATVVAKIVEYETANAFGTWRRKASFFASEGHFGNVDQLLEKMAKNMFKHNVLPLFDLSMTYANPKMEYFYPADEFGGKVLERFRENPLFMIYIGHGQVKGFDTVRFEGERHPIMGMDDVAKLNGGGGRYPIVFIIACLTGYFDNPQYDSIGEELLNHPKGPVGVFASSRVSDPYSNGVLSKEIANALLYNLEPRIGDALVMAKRAMMENRDKDRKYIDKFATMFMPVEDMAKSIREHLYLYNYLGDPATAIQFPMHRMDVKTPKEAKPGSKISVMGRRAGMSGGRALVTLECEAVKTIHPIKPIKELEGDEYRETVRQNYANANNKVVTSAEVPVVGGRFETTLEIPPGIPPGRYYVKVYAEAEEMDAAGYAEVIIKTSEPQPGTED